MEAIKQDLFSNQSLQMWSFKRWSEGIRGLTKSGKEEGLGATRRRSNGIQRHVIVTGWRSRHAEVPEEARSHRGGHCWLTTFALKQGEDFLSCN